MLSCTVQLGTIPEAQALHFKDKEASADVGRNLERMLHRGFFQRDDSFQFTKDSGQGSEKSGWLIHSYDFTLQRAREKRSDTAES